MQCIRFKVTGIGKRPTIIFVFIDGLKHRGMISFTYPIIALNCSQSLLFNEKKWWDHSFKVEKLDFSFEAKAANVSGVHNGWVKKKLGNNWPTLFHNVFVICGLNESLQGKKVRK